MPWLTLLSLVTLAQPANPYLDEARRLVREVKFTEALEQLAVARQVPGLTVPQTIEVTELTARCLIAEGHRDEAEAAYVELLTLAPSFAPDRNLSPKILEVFDAAKARLYPPDYLKLVREAAPPGRVRVTVIDPWHRVGSVSASVQEGDGPQLAMPTQTAGDQVVFEVSSAPASRLRWRLQASDAAGTPVASIEDVVEARERPPPPGPAPVVEPALASRPTSPRWARAVPWVASAVAVAAAGFATGLQLSSRSLASAARDPSTSPGDWADTARAANQQAQQQARWSVGLYIAAGACGAVVAVGFAW